MKVEEIPVEQWADFLARVTKEHQGWLVSLEHRHPAAKTLKDASEIALREVAVEKYGANRETGIVVLLGQIDGGHLSHVIPAPVVLKVLETNDGEQKALRIEQADGQAAVLRFRAAVSPDTENRLVRIWPFATP